ncbi:MAG TPA: hypothetical protein VGB56_01725, partial [Flavisolibacter sp.]
QTPNNPQEPTKNILVPQTGDTVMRLLVSGPINPPTVLTPAETKMISDSAVVVRYGWKGKTYYAGAAAVKTLAPLMHQ